jgi:hypothetical protein
MQKKRKESELIRIRLAFDEKGQSTREDQCLSLKNKAPTR